MKDKRIWIIFLIIFVNILGFGIILPILPYFAETMGASAITIGMLTAVFSLCQLIASPILGELSDKYGRRPILLFSILGTAVSFLLLGAAKTIPMLFLSRIIDGLSGGNISTAQAYVADITSKEERSQALGILGAAFGLGFVMGPAVGGGLSVYGYSVPAYLAAGVSLLALILTWFFLSESVNIKVKMEFRTGKILFSLKDLMSVLTHKLVGNLVIVTLLLNTAFTIMQGTFSLFAEHALGLNAAKIGFVLTYVGVMSIIGQLIILKQILRIFSEKRIMFASILLLSISLLIMGFSTSITILLVSVSLMALGQSLLNPVVTGLISKATPEDEQGNIMGLSQSVASIGRLVGPILGTFLFGIANHETPFIAAAIIMLSAVYFIVPKKYYLHF